MLYVERYVQKENKEGNAQAEAITLTRKLTALKNNAKQCTNNAPKQTMLMIG
jgi:hypothetical protein